jgi:hypothetical protein
MKRILDFRFWILDYGILANNPKSKIQNPKCERIYASLLLLALVLLSMVPQAEGCPGCKEALFDPAQLSQKLATAKGYALSIGLLLAVPFALVGAIAAIVVRAQRRKAG